ncbi:MAG: rhodanese-related sulfurtransferase [Rhodospirillaceae bacterium]|nr:rhodanese-related sulfurtransferase [Rhodospirillaceae bacterium]
MRKILVAALYKFATLNDYVDLQPPLLAKCKAEGVIGTLLLAREGINGTISGSAQGIKEVLDFIRQDPRLADLTHKESFADEYPFTRMKVRLKKEIVTMGVENLDPVHSAGHYVDAKDWNDFISDPDVIVVDTRNGYEVEIGTFKGAIDPKTTSFREFPKWVRESGLLDTKKKVAMFCTGGIRCEKSTAFMRQQGVGEVYHLKDGILKYLETIPVEESLWQGDCFVFDERVSVGHGLVQGTYGMCYGCGHAIDEEDKNSPLYEPGVCCPKCHDKLSVDQKSRFAERQKQIDLAKARGDVLLGQAVAVE